MTDDTDLEREFVETLLGIPYEMAESSDSAEWRRLKAAMELLIEEHMGEDSP